MKVIGLAGWSGAGKTTLLKRVIPHLLKGGLRVSVIKHAHHEFDVDVDLVIVEGFKREPHRKVEVHRAANQKPLLFPDDPGIVGIATDIAVATTLPTAHLDDVEAVVALLQRSAISVEDVLAKSEA